MNITAGSFGSGLVAWSTMTVLADGYLALPLWFLGTHVLGLLFACVALLGAFLFDPKKEMVAIMICCATEFLLTLQTGIHLFSGGSTRQTALMLGGILLSAIVPVTAEFLWAAALGVFCRRELAVSVSAEEQTKGEKVTKVQTRERQWNRPTDLLCVERVTRKYTVLEEEGAKKSPENEFSELDPN